jgi:hypothetical protein
MPVMEADGVVKGFGFPDKAPGFKFEVVLSFEFWFN